MRESTNVESNWSQRLFLRLLREKRSVVLTRAAAVIAGIALVDWRFDVNISFGFLYLFPMLMVGGCLARWQMALVAALCTGLSEAFDPFPWAPAVGVPRLILTFAAFFGAGLYVFEATRRQEAEEQLEFLVATSPATMFILDTFGHVLIANEAAHRLLGLPPGQLEGSAITRFFPALTSVPPLTGNAPFFRTSMECHGTRHDGEMFLARIWFSTYRTVLGPRLAAVVFDASEELRDREEFSLQQLLSGSRILVGAVSHEIRNLCGAISVVHARLARTEAGQVNEDLRALGTLVEALGRLAGLELAHSTRPAVLSVDLHAVLEDLRIIIDAPVRDAGIDIQWEVPADLPHVWADRQALLQVLLNLTKNSQRAMEHAEHRQLTIQARREQDRVAVRVIDTGHGVGSPERLFQPFQEGAEATGLGLYLSRAFLRAFDGDVIFEPRPAGCSFAIVLAVVNSTPTQPLPDAHAENTSVVA
jgi:PAS domain S-box-containing protein